MVSVQISASEPVAIFGSPEYLKRRGAPSKPADLARHDRLSYLQSAGKVRRWELVDDGKAAQ